MRRRQIEMPCESNARGLSCSFWSVAAYQLTRATKILTSYGWTGNKISPGYVIGHGVGRH